MLQDTINSTMIPKKTCLKFCKNYVYFVQMFILNNDFAFIGSTLWSHIPSELHPFIKNYMNDYRVIYSDDNENGEVITPFQTNALFLKNYDFIYKSIADAKKSGHKAIVLTHHTPSFIQTLAPQYALSPSSYAFCNYLPVSLWNGPIHLWCCGHTHFNFDHKKRRISIGK